MPFPQRGPHQLNLKPDIIFLVADSNLPKAQVSALIRSVEREFVNVPILDTFLVGGEAIKSKETLSSLWALWLLHGLNRSSLVIAAGGGTITDVVGFAASTFNRGVNWIAVPTTLLCMVDAAVGGKTGINEAGIKNLVGSFWPPVRIWTEAEWLKSLPQRELWNGWMEMTKHALISNADLWDQTATASPSRASTDELFEWALRSAEIKQQIVAADPLESGERKILNFGHTLGHAIEACSMEATDRNEQTIPHGMAVGWGMCWALRWSAERTPAFKSELLAAESVLRKWLAEADFAYRPPFAPEALWAKMRGDKKNQAGQVLDIALEGIGKPKWDQPVTWELFESVWQQLD